MSPFGFIVVAAFSFSVHGIILFLFTSLNPEMQPKSN